MSAAVTLDSFLTTLTCLSAVSNVRPTIRLNSKEEFKVTEAVGCPSRTLTILHSQIRQLIDADHNFQEEISKVDQSVAKFNTQIRNLNSKTDTVITSCIDQPNGYNAISVANLGNLIVYCEHNFLNLGPNWLMIAKRDSGDLDFFNDWDDYKQGFGELSREFFIGLEKLNAITTNQSQELLIYLEKDTGESAYAHYDFFTIGNEYEKYALKILGKHNGTAGDALRYHVGQKFTTYDMDNDIYKQSNCAEIHAGAWWYAECIKSNLFGKYQTEADAAVGDFKGILWKGFLDGPKGSLKVVKMFIRPKP